MTCVHVVDYDVAVVAGVGEDVREDDAEQIGQPVQDKRHRTLLVDDEDERRFGEVEVGLNRRQASS